MKKLLITTIAILGLAGYTPMQAQIVHIPDAIFKAELLNNPSINTNGDLEIQVSEASAFNGSINLYNFGISDLTGIEAFTALTELYCGFNKLKSLDISNNTSLIVLDCHGNQLTSLDISKNTALIELICSGNQFTSLDVSKNSALTKLVCTFNQITSLDFSLNTVLTDLDCSFNQITSLDVSKNKELIFLSCNGNELTSLDVTKKVSLKQLNCGYNQLTGLDVSNNTLLEELRCHDNQITDLDLSRNTALIHLSCYYNQLTNLDVSNNISLFTLSCGGNQITSIDVSKNVALKELSCEANQLTKLDIKNGNNLNLQYLYAKDNPDLICVQVDDTVWSVSNWINKIDTTAFFSENCSTALDVDNINKDNTLTVFPNPTQGKLFLSAHSNVVLTDLTGKVILQKQNTNQIDISELPQGLYFINVGDNLKKTFKVMKE